MRKYGDAATIFMLTILLPDSSLKRQDRLATKNSQAMGQANKRPVSPLCVGGGMTGWQSRREATYQLENYHEQKPRHYHKNMRTQGEKKRSFCENTVIGYLYVDDSSRSPRLSHSVNCLAVHLSANSWLNLNIL